MANVILFHPSLGYTKDMKETAQWLRDAGHAVFAPDLFDGKTFDDDAKADEHLKGLTIPAVMLRAKEAIAAFPADSAYMGFSIGALAAMIFAAKKPGARACVPVAGAAMLTEIGAQSWPKGVPVSIHFAAGDPWRRPDAIASFGEAVRSSGAAYESFDYPCGGHLFPFAGTKAYDPESAERFRVRVLAFLARLD